MSGLNLVLHLQVQVSKYKLNANSLTAQNRLDEIALFTETNNVDILMISETKLDSNVHPNLYKIDNFQPPYTKHRNRYGGGVAIYARNSIATERVTHLEFEDEESIWIRIKIRHHTILAGCIYFPPNPTSLRIQEFVSNLNESICHAQTSNPDSIIVMGDMNTGNIFLSTDMNYKHSGITPFDNQLADMLDSLHLTQLISHPTRITDNTENLRDLAITNNTAITSNSGTLSPFSKMDHCPIYTTLLIKKPNASSRVEKIMWDYDKLDSDKLIQTLTGTNWDNILNQDTETATAQFTKAILDAADAAIPKKLSTSRRKTNHG